MKHANRIIVLICLFWVFPYVSMSQIVPDYKIYSNGRIHQPAINDSGIIHLVIGDSYNGAYYLQLDTSFQALSDTIFLYQSGSSKYTPSIDINTEHIGIVWYESGSGGLIPNGRITGVLLNKSFNPIIEEYMNFDDEDSDLGVFQKPEICFLNDTLLVATWTGYSDKYSSDAGSYGQLMTISNELVGSNFDITDQSPEMGYIEKIKTCSYESSSNFISIWYYMHSAENVEIYGRIFDHTGTAKDSSFLITTDTSMTNKYCYSLDIDNDGNTMIVWSAQVNSVWNVFYRWYDSLGVPLTDILSITDNSHEVNSFSEVDCFISDDNKSIIEWENVENRKKCIYAQRFNNDRSPRGKPFRVTSENYLHDQIVPRVLLNNDRIYTFWQGSGASWANVLDFYDQESSVENNVLPLIFSLSQNYPNPFNPTTAISYQLSADSKVELSVYDLSGKKVATLVKDHLSAGEYETVWNAAEFSSGIYIARLVCGDSILSKKMLLIK